MNKKWHTSNATRQSTKTKLFTFWELTLYVEAVYFHYHATKDWTQQYLSAKYEAAHENYVGRQDVFANAKSAILVKICFAKRVGDRYDSGLCRGAPIGVVWCLARTIVADFLTQPLYFI